MKKLMIIIAFFTLNISNSQDKVSLEVFQDAKLMFIGDGERYEKGTINIIGRLKMEGLQSKYGFLTVFPEYEYAEIQGIYKRYSAGIGYNFNRLIINNWSVEAFITYGWIDRDNASSFSYSFGLGSYYKLNKSFSIALLGQMTERKDLKVLWNDNALRFSGFFGLKIGL
ncbi:hypothetical protein [uncultured Winogradskyella sp.]|uniref:hypothetical protein n=1 Tax=uncultured Winogradskyella sp. TaxID=395353 RepID=UPI002620ABFF|nr:hypothetical protein [uncultured Winogradskyella sp.]